MRHFDICVIGSGSGSMVVDGGFDGLSVAMVDGAERFGGTCLNTGCIPTKMFAYPADLAASASEAEGLGLHADVRLDWAEVRDRVFGRIDHISLKSEEGRRTAPGTTLFRVNGVFTGPKRLRVGDDEITADTFVLAAGSRPFVPKVPGVASPELAGRLHTSDDVLRLPELPEHLVVVGGGVVAAELAQVFSAFGSEVTLVHRGERLLRHADAEVAEAFTQKLAERVNLRLCQSLTGFAAAGKGRVAVETRDPDGVEYDFEGDQVLLATGRVPNADLLDVAATGVAVDAAGRVVVDAFQRTGVPGIFALGDICSPKQLKHVANQQARVVRANILHPRLRVRSNMEHIPQAVFSRPQVAWAGLTEAEAAAAGVPFTTSRRPYSSVAHGWAMGERDGFVKLVADTKTGKLVGAHVIGPDAANLIQPLTQLMALGLDVRTSVRSQYWIHPALVEVVENALLDLAL
jgi:mycothione reductase